MIELFQTIPKSLLPKSPDDYKEKCQTTIKAVIRKWYIYKIHSKLIPIKRG